MKKWDLVVICWIIAYFVALIALILFIVAWLTKIISFAEIAYLCLLGGL